MNNMPTKLRKELAADPYYHTCARAGIDGHVCAGRVTWDHAIIVAGRQLQEGWAIVPLCEKAHGVGKWLDLHEKKPEMSQWIALNRAPEERLEELTRLGGLDYLRRRNYLNQKYGILNTVFAYANTSGINYPPSIFV